MDSLDLTVVAAAGDANITLVARRGCDIAVDSIPASGLAPFVAFGQRLERVIKGAEDPLARADVQAFGKELFKSLTPDGLQPILSGLPKERLTLSLLSNRADFQAIPWEYLQEPGQAFGPSVNRSIVRIVPTVGVKKFEPLRLDRKVRILFVSADPTDQDSVSWPDVKATIERRFAAELPAESFEFEAIEGASAKALATHIQGKPDYDIVHFSCHGEVVAGEGRLILVDLKTRKSSPLTSSQLCGLLQGRGIRLVVLSACQTSAGNFASDFSVMSDALVRCGVPAVVANQLPVHNTSVPMFVGALYEELLQSGDIDTAVSEGRVSLWVELQGDHAVLEWGIPTLHRHVDSRQVLAP
jgi:CHAT domain-containing protein